MRFFCKLYTLSKSVIYTFTFRYSLASRVFPNAKYYVIHTELARMNWWKEANALHADTKLGKLSDNLIFIGWVSSKMGERNWTLKPGVSHKWFDKSSKLIEWFLHDNSDWIIFDLTTSLLGIFDIYWMSTAFALAKNGPSAHRKSLRTRFSPNSFNKSLIKCGKIFSFLMQWWKKYGKRS